jgi:3-oxoacyl-[acyl-carrier protein] reductase
MDIYFEETMEFTNKVAIVTGSASGIGSETALLLGRRGASVVLADIQTDKGNGILEQLRKEGIKANYIETDVTNVREIEDLCTFTIENYSSIDILVNSAGITKLTSIPDISVEEWNRVLSINLTSTFFCSQKVLEYMKKQGGGRIVNIASSAGRVGGVAVGAHYSASKAAVICLTKSLAQYGAKYKIHVNCVSPGPTATPMTKDWDESTSNVLKEKIPLGRFGTPEEIARAICFMASEEAGFITGATLDVTGGLVM